MDPAKESAAKAINSLQNHGVTVKVLTGDNAIVAQKFVKMLEFRLIVIVSEVKLILWMMKNCSIQLWKYTFCKIKSNAKGTNY